MNPERWRQIEQLYHDALERPEGERAAFLDKSCSDADLRREVEDLLRAGAETGGKFDRPAMQPTETVEMAQARSLVGRKLLRGGGAECLEAFDDPYWIAAVYAELHELEETFRWLEKAYEDRSTQIIFLKAEPKFDPVRSDPRYAKLLERMRL